MIFFCPISNRINHIFSEHCVFGSSVITASRAVRECSVFIHSVIIIRYSILERRVSIICVIVNYIHNNTDSGIMKCLNHLFALFYAHIAVVRIGRIRTLGTIVVYRVITPVILFHYVFALVNRTKIIKRHNLNVLYAKLF